MESKTKPTAVTSRFKTLRISEQWFEALNGNVPEDSEE